MTQQTILIRNASAILTGKRSDGERHAGPDIRIADGVIARWANYRCCRENA
jgi:hypothetical protein